VAIAEHAVRNSLLYAAASMRRSSFSSEAYCATATLNLARVLQCFASYKGQTVVCVLYGASKRKQCGFLY
jgi:hypothetical protein